MTAAFVIIFGLAFGSFANVLIFRLPRNENFTTGRSHCPACGAPIAFYDNIPLISFLILRGRCRSCHSPISLRYPLVELVSALLFYFAYTNFGLSLMGGAAVAFLFMLLVLSAIDIMTMFVDDRMLIFGGLAALLPFFSGDHPLIPYLAAAAGYSAGLLAVALLGKLLYRRDSMGGGDIKLAFVIGLMLGPVMSLLSAFLAFVTAALILIILRIIGRIHRGQEVPFVPFMAAGSVLALLWGEEILKFYRTLLH